MQAGKTPGQRPLTSNMHGQRSYGFPAAGSRGLLSNLKLTRYVLVDLQHFFRVLAMHLITGKLSMSPFQGVAPLPSRHEVVFLYKTQNNLIL